MRGLARRIAKLERVQDAAQGGGVVLKLWGGDYEYREQVYVTLPDLPPGSYLVVPEPLGAKEWEALAMKQQQAASMGNLS